MARYQQASTSQLTRLRKLQKRKYRAEMGLFVAEGLRTVQQIVELGSLSVGEVYITESYLDDQEHKWLPDSTFVLSDKDMRSVADAESPQGILAIAHIPAQADIGERIKRPGRILAFDRIQDPGNMGTIIRTAAWFGIDFILLGSGSVDQWNPKVVRSTAGATGSIPYAECDLEMELERFAQAGWRPALLDGNPGSVPIEEWDPGMRTILVVGNEAQGISDVLASRYDRYKIETTPGQNAAESLNASIAAGIALYVLSQKAVSRT